MANWWQRLRSSRRLTELSPAEGYRRWAPDYGREPNAFQQLEAKALDGLMPDVAGRWVLDLGCGKGRVGRLALERGAAGAVGSDLSLAMLTGEDSTLGSQLVATVDRPLPFRPASFDVVVCALVLGHVEDLEVALASMAAVLRPGGHLVVSDFHPYATLRGWQRTYAEPGGGKTRAIAQHLHLFSDYVGALERLGLAVEALAEPLWQGSPVVFVMRARKAQHLGSSPAGARYQ